jgi:DNA-binding XRE family transcriptional regulator
VTVLVGSKTWKRERPRRAKATMRPCELTLSEQHNVRAMVLRLRAEHRSWKSLAAALGVNRITLVRAQPGKQAPTAGLALRVARLVGVTVDCVLAGRMQPPRACLNCGADLLSPGR